MHSCSPEVKEPGGTSQGQGGGAPDGVRRRWAWWGLVMLAPLVPLAIFLYAGFAGLDFGDHWDERDHLQNITVALQTRTLLPTGTWTYQKFPELRGGYYGYPSMLFWLGMGAVAAEVMADLPNAGGAAAIDFVDSPAYLLRYRAVCLVLSSLAIVWVYIAALVVSGRVWVALVAAAVLAGSFEYSYHARWVASDTLVMQFAAMCLMGSVLAVRRGAGWLWLAAGLATATKYPAALLLVVVWAAAVAQWQGEAGRRWGVLVRRVVLLGGVAFATFLVITPGAVLQPWHFVSWLNHNRIHYGQAGHAGYTIRDQGTHLLRIGEYLSLVLFSRWSGVAAVITVLAGVGVVAAGWRMPRMAVVLAALPVIYVLYYSSQVVLTVRNVLIVGPFLAVLAALGAGAVWRWLRLSWARGMWAAVLVVLLGVNLAAVMHAGRSIDDRRQAAWQVEALRAFMSADAQGRFWLSEKVSAEIGDAAAGEGVVGPSDADYLVLRASEGVPLVWVANLRGLTERVFGPADVNFDYYPSWSGSDRIVVIGREHRQYIPMAHLQRAMRQEDLRRRAEAGWRLAAYLDCGAMSEAGEGPELRVVTGENWTAAPPMAGLWPHVDVAYHRNEVAIAAVALEAGRPYRIGFSWWDAGGHGRVQSVWISDAAGERVYPLVPATRLPQHDAKAADGGEPPAEFVVDVPEELRGEREVRLLVRREGAQNVRVGEVWLYERVGDW